MRKKTILDLPRESVAGRRLLVRVDFNVPLDGEGRVTDDARIRASLPTLERLCGQRARVTLMSHLGRPRGAPDPALSLAPVAGRLGELLAAPVAFSGATVGEDAERAVEALGDGAVLVLENTRFLAGETEDDAALSAAMAALGDVYVNDAFGAAHRAHASTHGVALAVRRRGGEAVAGLLMERELRYLGEALASPERPFVAVLGGAKISGKIDVIDALLPRVDRLLVGGAMANTFFRALGLETGASLVEEDRVPVARRILEGAANTIVLPVDCVVAEELRDDASSRVVERDGIAAGDRVGDIGPATRQLFAAEVRGARTVLWNGPMGVFEMRPFAEGTLQLAREMAAAADDGAVVVVGGGDSASAAREAGVANRMSHVSTGGGASLEFLAGRELPGVAVLDDSEEG